MTDKELILGCIAKDKRYQKLLFDRFAGRFMTICLRYASNQSEAEDMLQEGFIEIFENIDKFRFEGVFDGWITKIMVHNCLKIVKQKRINYVSEDYIKEEQHNTDPYLFESVTEKELLKLINALPTGYKIVFNLNIIEGYSHEEIAEMLGVETTTSRSQLLKARKMLQKQIIELQKIAV